MFPVDPIVGKIEAAFGADLHADPSTWVYYDCTADWLTSQDLSATIGRTDATSKAQPAKLIFWLKNAKGDYTKGNPLSKWWPYIRKNTPIRVTLNPGTGHTRQYTMYATKWLPRWGGNSGRQPLVQVTANGIRQRLTQGASPLRSVLYRSTVAAKPAAYWSLEEEATSASFGEALGRAPMLWSGGAPKRGSGGPPGSAPLVTLAADTALIGAVAPYVETSPGWWGAQMVVRVPDAQGGQDIPILDLYIATGTFYIWRLWYGNNGGLGAFYWVAYDRATRGPSATLGATGIQTFSDGHGWGHDIIVGFNVHQSGGNILLDGAYASPDDPGGLRLTFTASIAGTNGHVEQVVVPFAQGYPHTDWVVGHISVWPGQFSLYDKQMYGYDGETVHDRMVRLCTEEGIPATISAGATARMGPQRIGTFMQMMEDGEAADGGILLDGLSPGFKYLARQDAYNLPVALTIDMAGRQLKTPFEPQDDDIGLANDVTVSRVNGSSARYIDKTGPAGTDAINTYTDSPTLNLYTDADLPGQASWRAHVETAGGDALRFPTIGFDLHTQAGAALIEPWLTSGVRTRLQALHPPAEYGTGPIDLLVEGYTETVRNRRVWSVAANASPYAPWIVWQMGSSVTGRVDSSSTTVRTTVPAGSSSVQVTVGGVPWTTDPTKLPAGGLDLNVDGIKVKVTAITGATSPQTFTVDPATVVKQLTAGRPVHLWQPAVVGL